MANEHDVRTRMTMDVSGARSGARGLQSDIRALSGQISTTQGLLTGMTRQLIGVGLAYVGLNAGVAAFTGLTRGAIQYTSALDSSKISIAAVVNAVDGIGWSASKAVAGDAFEKIKDLSLTSPAGPKEMFDIFTGIIGPLRSAEVSMERIYKMTNNVVLASGAIGVDYAQMQRDIAGLLTGNAGLENKTFRMMRSMNLITESTEQWNQKLTATERALKLETALGAFQEAGDDFGRSWAGVTATFGGIVDEAKRAFVAPVMMRLADRLFNLNDLLTENADTIAITLDAYGNRAADAIDHVIDKGIVGFHYIQDHWDQIENGFDRAMDTLEKHGPTLAKVAAGMVVADAGRNVVGGALNLGANTMAAGSTVAGLFAVNAAKAAPAATAAAGVTEGWMASSSAAMLFGDAVGGAGAGAAAAGGGGAAAAAGGGFFAGGPLAWAAGLAAVVTVGVAFVDNSERMMVALGDANAAFGPFMDGVMTLGHGLWSFLKPILESVGLIVFTVLVTGWRALGATLSFFSPILETVGSIFEMVGDALQDNVVPALRTFLGWINSLKTAAGIPDDEREHYERQKNFELGFSGAYAEPERERHKTPNTRAGTTIKVDKMIVKQEFRGARDPDRILATMINDITKQAERRVSVRYAGALTRG